MIYTGLLSLLLAEYAANQKCSAVLLCSADSIYPLCINSRPFLRRPGHHHALNPFSDQRIFDMYKINSDGGTVAEWLAC